MRGLHVAVPSPGGEYEHRGTFRRCAVETISGARSSRAANAQPVRRRHEVATEAHTFSLDVTLSHDLRLDAPEVCPHKACVTPSEEAERFELFRRAVCERDEAAWEELSRLYH